MTEPKLDAACWWRIPSHADPRGVLTVVESEQDIPFPTHRVYWLHGLKAGRGGHAHMDTYQLVTAATGRFLLSLSDGERARTFEVDRPSVGVLFGPMLFIRIHEPGPGAVALVLASTHYDKKRSIRSWPDYLEAVGRAGLSAEVPTAELIERP